MNKRVLIASALATAVAAPSACGQSPTPVPAPTPPFKAEKCYGIARAGENDCASTGYNECARTSRKALDLRAWIYVPVGYCQRIQGGTLRPRL
jgi:uncharacterized membrane protein